MDLQWPMNVLTRSTGDSFKLITHPQKIIGREYLTPDGDCTDTSKIKIPDGTYYVEKKEQGHFHIYARDANGIYTMFGRRLGVDGAFNDVYPKINGHIDLPSIPINTAIAVELVWPGHPDSAIPTAIKDSPHVLRIKGLGIAISHGKDAKEYNFSYEYARKIMIYMIGHKNCVEQHGKYTLDKHNKPLVIKELLGISNHLGIEGWVLKGKGYSDWWKLKGIQEADVFITGFKISESDTYDGQITAVEIGVYENGRLIHMGRVSGFDDNEKTLMTRAFHYHGTGNANPYLYRVLRITYQEVAAKGKLKHGFFDSWRDDKDHSDCEINQFND